MNEDIIPSWWTKPPTGQTLLSMLGTSDAVSTPPAAAVAAAAEKPATTPTVTEAAGLDGVRKETSTTETENAHGFLHGRCFPPSGGTVAMTKESNSGENDGAGECSSRSSWNGGGGGRGYVPPHHSSSSTLPPPVTAVCGGEGRVVGPGGDVGGGGSTVRHSGTLAKKKAYESMTHTSFAARNEVCLPSSGHWGAVNENMVLGDPAPATTTNWRTGVVLGGGDKLEQEVGVEEEKQQRCGVGDGHDATAAAVAAAVASASISQSYSSSNMAFACMLAAEKHCRPNVTTPTNGW